MKKRKIDVIGVTLTDKDNPAIVRNRIVLNAAEMGIGAEIIDRSKRVRGKIKSRFLSTWQELSLRYQLMKATNVT